MALQEGQSDDGRSAYVGAIPAQGTEIEAVISCTSDGLVVVLRRARPQIPSGDYNDGLFAAPWGAEPIQPLQPSRSSVRATGGPPTDSFMASIREVAVFAWSLTGINGNIATYGHGTPTGEAVPPTGFPVWDPHAQNTGNPGPENQAYQKWTQMYQNSLSSSQHSQGSSTHSQAPPPYERTYFKEDAPGSYFPRSLQQAYMPPETPRHGQDRALDKPREYGSHSSASQEGSDQSADLERRRYMWF